MSAHKYKEGTLVRYYRKHNTLGIVIAALEGNGPGNIRTYQVLWSKPPWPINAILTLALEQEWIEKLLVEVGEDG